MRLIDADALIQVLCVNMDTGQQFNRATHCVDVMPAVDAVPVIRCKECKFSKAYYHGSESNLGMFTYLCTQGLYGMNAEDYCSRAERKDDETD